MTTKNTLHDVIAQILQRCGPLSANEIASEVNKLGAYNRGDGNPVPSSQISARVHNYPHMFERTSGIIRLNSQSTSASIVKLPLETAGNPSSNMTIASSLENMLFYPIGTVEALCNTGLPRDVACLNHCGIYRISIPHGYKPEYISQKDAAASHNVISPWPEERLMAKWVSDAEIIYIGLAGDRSLRTLRERLIDLIRHASGQTSDRGPHRGGEILWQLRNFCTFSIDVSPTSGPPVPRNIEMELLEQFVKHYGKLPFGNRRG